MKPRRVQGTAVPACCRGYTLVEVLVALAAMAILATLSWQGLDGIVRARDGSGAVLDRTARLSTVLTQWEQDLLAVHDTAVVPALSFDGQTLRLTRRVEDGVALVAWSLRGGVWQRWASPAVVRAAELQELWLSNQQFLGNEPGHVRLVEGASDYRIFFFRGGAWTNAQSTGDLVPVAPVLQPGAPAEPDTDSGAAGPAAGGDNAAQGPAAAGSAPQSNPPLPRAPEAVQLRREALPEAVRLLIHLERGTLTRDVALGPSGA